jgi:hypothetical protein
MLNHTENTVGCLSPSMYQQDLGCHEIAPLFIKAKPH